MSKHQPDSPRQKWRFQKNKKPDATVSGQLQQLGTEKQIGGKIFCFFNLLLPGQGLDGFNKKYNRFGFLFVLDLLRILLPGKSSRVEASALQFHSSM